VNSSIAQEYLRGLAKAGFIGLTQEPTRVQPNRYRLLRDNGIEAPRVKKDGSPVTQGLAQEQMWRTLRTIKGDTNASELAAHASTSKVKVAVIAASDYLLHLNKADYLTCTAPGKGVGRGGIQARYRLTRNTGPKPPMVQRIGTMYDPNLNEVVWSDPVTEESAIYDR